MRLNLSHSLTIHRLTVDYGYTHGFNGQPKRREFGWGVDFTNCFWFRAAFGGLYYSLYWALESKDD
jgi:hypothetical protein